MAHGKAVNHRLIEESRRNLWMALWQILSVLVSCLIAEWVVLALVGVNKIILAVPIVLALMLMIYSHLVYGETLQEIGFRFDNFFAASRLLLIPTAVAVALIIFLSAPTLMEGVGRSLRWRFLLLPLAM